MVKVISVWSPWSSLIVAGFKKVETRSWPAPKALVGTRIAIAATKALKAAQIAAYGEPQFQQFYCQTRLPGLDSLPRGAILGTVILAACEPMTEAMIQATEPQERMFGIWEQGRYAWILDDPQPLAKPIPVRGSQGVWVWQDDDQMRAH